MPHHKPPELLAPAGSLNKLRYAFAFGADAVYAGIPRYALRARNNEFRLEELKEGVRDAHQHNKKLYLTVNIFAHDAKQKTFIRDLEPIVALQPDALIMADPGLILLVRERWPEIALHLSVQANTVNSSAVRFWQQVGIARVILSRELSLEQIAEIRDNCPDMELEVFVHGALCIAWSGRCLLSGYFNHRDANQGVCTNSCRWKYRLLQHADTPSLVLEEDKRRGEYLPIDEDENGTYILNAKDLRAIEYIARLVAIGVDSLKIEGRTKSAWYVARTTLAYRQAIDAAMQQRSLPQTTLDLLAGLAQRGYTSGFLDRHAPKDLQNYASGDSVAGNRHYVGDVLSHGEGYLDIEVKNRFQCGDTLELMTPDICYNFVLETMQDVRTGQMLTTAPGSGWRVRIPTPPIKTAPRPALLARIMSN